MRPTRGNIASRGASVFSRIGIPSAHPFNSRSNAFFDLGEHIQLVNFIGARHLFSCLHLTPTAFGELFSRYSVSVVLYSIGYRQRVEY
jgi:hypothetical protein